MSKSIHRPEYAVLTQHLRQARRDAGIHQSELAAALKRSQSFVSDVENGSRRLDLLELRDVCKVLGVDFLAFVQSVENDLQARQARRRTARRIPPRRADS